MRVFKTTYKDRKGKTCTSSKWYIEFKDHLETVRRLPAFTSKPASEEMGRNLEKLVAYHKATGGQVDPSLSRWLSSLPQKTRDKLVAIGLLDAQRVAVSKPLADHLDDWAQFLQSKDTSPKHVKLVMGRARRVFRGCGFTFYPDINATKVMAFLSELRTSQNISAQTFNFYIKVIKQFCAWMIKHRRASESPVAHLDLLNVKTDRRHDRRVLQPDELTSVLKATRESQRTFRDLAGEDRSLLYLTACGSGFRASELSVLHPENFDLDSVPPTVTLPARFTKSKKPVIQPLPAEIAENLRSYLKDRVAGERVWPGTWWEKAAEMLKGDLEAIGIPYIVDGPDGPLYADFHSLRHGYVSRLARSGVSPKMTQELARHSDIRLTMNRYAHATLYDLGAAVDSLPPLLSSQLQAQRNAMRATGTDGAAAEEPVLAFCLAQQGRSEGPSVDADGRSTENSDVAIHQEFAEKTANSQKTNHYARQGSNLQPAVPKTAALSS